MLDLQKKGCHNINFISPTHVVAPLIRATILAIEGGLNLPIVWNTGGYDSLDTLRLMEGIVDIYMPDLKYSDNRLARKYSGVMDYPEANRAGLKEI